MKDKEARENITFLLDWHQINDNGIKRISRNLSDVSIKDCPKCKQRRMVERYYAPPGLGAGGCYQCLTCGTRFTCSEKQVCEIIKEE